MTIDVVKAKDFLINIYGAPEKVPVGVHLIPMNKNGHQVYLKVNIDQQMGMSQFSYYWDENMKNKVKDHQLSDIRHDNTVKSS